MKKLNSQGTVLTEFSRRTQGHNGVRPYCALDDKDTVGSGHFVTSGPTVPSMINKVAYENNDNSSGDAGRDGGIGTR